MRDLIIKHPIATVLLSFLTGSLLVLLIGWLWITYFVIPGIDETASSGAHDGEAAVQVINTFVALSMTSVIFGAVAGAAAGVAVFLLKRWQSSAP